MRRKKLDLDFERGIRNANKFQQMYSNNIRNGRVNGK